MDTSMYMPVDMSMDTSVDTSFNTSALGFVVPPASSILDSTCASDTYPPINPLFSERPSRELLKHRQAFLKNPDQFVTFFVEDDEERFTIHTDFACHYSPVLSAAFNGPFIEGQTQEYRFQETTKGAVHQLANWLYTQKVEITSLGPVGDFTKAEIDRDLHEKENQTLIDTWLLAQRLLIPKLQNFIIRELHRIKMQSGLGLKSYIAAYEKSGEGSALRRYLVASCASSRRVRCLDRFPKEMFLDMLTALQDRDATMFLPPSQRIKPEYHMHDFEVPEN